MIRASIVAFFGVTLFAFYAHDAWLWYSVQQAPVSAMLEPPNVVFAVVATGLMLVGLARWRKPKLLTALIIAVLATDLIVLSSTRSPLSTEVRAKAALQVMTEGAQALATTKAVPDTAADLEPALPLLGPVPWLVHGERPAQWQLELHFGCSGPLAKADGAPVGTVLYCVAPERRRAWVTLVGLPLGTERGEAGVVSMAPDWVGEVSLAREDAEPPDPAEAPDVDVEPTPADESR